MGRQEQTRPVDWEIAVLARRQHGLVTRLQLGEIGLGEGAIDRRLRGGRLHRVHESVYAVGHPLLGGDDGRQLAAVLACGSDAVLSHRSAAALWGGIGSPGRTLEVSTPRKSRSKRSIKRHRLLLPPDEMTLRRGIPVTTLERTMLDAASVLAPNALSAALREAEFRHRLRPARLHEFLDAHRGRRGAARLRSCLDRVAEGPRGRRRSPLEARFATLLEGSRLPMPQLNVLLDLGARKVEADCLWRRERLIVELDGGREHGTRSASESDKERDRRLQALGWRVVRVTSRQLDTPEPLLADLRRLLDSQVESAFTPV